MIAFSQNTFEFKFPQCLFMQLLHVAPSTLCLSKRVIYLLELKVLSSLYLDLAFVVEVSPCFFCSAVATDETCG